MTGWLAKTALLLEPTRSREGLKGFDLSGGSDVSTQQGLRPMVIEA